jgi:hypothetical protein
MLEFVLAGKDRDAATAYDQNEKPNR